MSLLMIILFFFKQKMAYELRISDWSSDVCSSDLICRRHLPAVVERDALAQLEDPLGGVGVGLPAFRQLGNGLDLLVELDQAIAPQETHGLDVGRQVGGRIEAVGRFGPIDPDPEIAAFLRRLLDRKSVV